MNWKSIYYIWKITNSVVLIEFLYTFSRISIPQFFVKLKINRILFLIFTRGIELYYTLFLIIYDHIFITWKNLEKVKELKIDSIQLDPIKWQNIILQKAKFVTSREQNGTNEIDESEECAQFIPFQTKIHFITRRIAETFVH